MALLAGESSRLFRPKPVCTDDARTWDGPFAHASVFSGHPMNWIEADDAGGSSDRNLCPERCPVSRKGNVGVQLAYLTEASLTFVLGKPHRARLLV
jgi:hypothetical protein